MSESRNAVVFNNHTELMSNLIIVSSVRIPPADEIPGVVSFHTRHFTDYLMNSSSFQVLNQLASISHRV
jgi:hypothetical protein